MTTKLPLTLEPATPADAELLAMLGEATARESFYDDNDPANFEAYIRQDFNPAQLRQELLDPRAYFLLAWQAGEAVGFAKTRHPTRKPRQLAGQRALELHRIYVLQKAQGQGVGKALLNACLELARLQNYQVLYLGVWERNGRGIVFYERAGFRRFGWHYFPFGTERQRDYWMKKEL